MKAKTKFTKLWSILLALAMVVGMLPIAALAAGSATATADFSTDPTAALSLLNAAKTGTTDITWDNDTKTLTLGGVNFVTSAATAVKLPDGATIVLNGENIIKSGSKNNCYGIYAEGSLTISGSGTLNVTGDTANSYSYGIYTNNGNISVTGGTVNAYGGNASYSYGIYAKQDMNIEDGTVNAYGGEAKFSRGIEAGNDISISGGIVNTKGGKASSFISYGIIAGNSLIISCGSLIAAGTSGSKNICALNMPSITLPGIPYWWRTSDSGAYTASTDTVYTLSSSHSYVEIRTAYTVTFDVNGANAAVAPASGTTNAAGKLTSLPEPTRSGYTFKEWNTKQDGSGTTVTHETTFTENTTVYAQWEGATVTIPSVAITGVDAPKSNTAFDTAAVCESAGVSNAKPTVTWDSSDSKAGYGKIYTASITLTASEGYVFADSTTVTVNGNPATSVTKNANGTLTVTYTFPATDKHNIEITLNTEIHDGDAVKNPTISSGYEIEICFFVEDTNKNGDFTDDKTLLLDKALVEEFIARPEIDMTLEEFIAALKDEGLDDVKTEYTGGYNYSFIAMVKHNEEVSFDDDEDGKVTDAIVKVNGKDITEKCGGGSALTVNPGAYVFSAAKTYTVSFDANGGKGTMADVTGISGEYTLPENGFTAPDGKQFKAWSVDGKEKAVGDKITVTADTTVKAVWETLPATPADYDILNGANSKWTQDSDGNISVRGSGEFSKFVGVKVDGKTVDEKYYTVKEGSTIVTLKPEYLNTLTAGKHTLEIVWTDGTADTTFTVDAKPANTDTKSPQTGDSSSIALWIALLFVSAAGVLSTAVLGKKKKRFAK